jgi:CDP-paratose 2-epimerase
MKIFITGICGFVGSTLAKALLAHRSDLEILGIDNFIRPGSETNRSELKALGIRIHHGDIRSASDIEAIPPVDAVIDAAANPSARRCGWENQLSPIDRTQPPWHY